MAVQTDYPDTQPAAIAGAQATMIPATIISRTVEVAPIGFGKAVAQGTDDKGCIAFAGSNFIGITVLDRSAGGMSVADGQVTARTPDTFGVGESARIMTKGDVWVEVPGAVSVGPVYLTSAGVFTSSSGGNTLIAGARFDTSTTGAGLAVVRLG